MEMGLRLVGVPILPYIGCCLVLTMRVCLVYGDFPLLALVFCDGVENETRGKGERPQENKAGCEKCARQAGNQPRLDEFRNDGKADNEADDAKNKGDEVEKLKGR